MTQRPKRSARKVSRDGILFVVGLLGIAHETLIANVDRPTLLILFAAMCGLPAFLRGDEVTQMRKRLLDPPKRDEDEQESPEEVDA